MLFPQRPPAGPTPVRRTSVGGWGWGIAHPFHPPAPRGPRVFYPRGEPTLGVAAGVFPTHPPPCVTHLPPRGWKDAPAAAGMRRGERGAAVPRRGRRSSPGVWGGGGGWIERAVADPPRRGVPPGVGGERSCPRGGDRRPRPHSPPARARPTAAAAATDSRGRRLRQRRRQCAPLCACAARPGVAPRPEPGPAGRRGARVGG